jgi:hypothetical protein
MGRNEFSLRVINLGAASLGDETGAAAIGNDKPCVWAFHKLHPLAG